MDWDLMGKGTRGRERERERGTGNMRKNMGTHGNPGEEMTGAIG